MSLSEWSRAQRHNRVPRTSGDEPQLVSQMTRRWKCSPRERGWARRRTHPPLDTVVFPVRAGVNLLSEILYSMVVSGPCLSGDEPVPADVMIGLACWSPRERR